MRSCGRLTQLNTGSTTSVLQSFDLGLAGAYVFYPAVTMNSAGDAYFVFSESSASLYASAATAAQRLGSPDGTLSGSGVIAQGLGIYNDCGSNCIVNGRNENRWGDYSAAAVDPVNPSYVWVTGEYAASASDPFDWGTEAAEVTLPQLTPRIFIPFVSK